MADQAGPKKPRLLCLHGFRTSGEILKKQISVWPEQVLQKLDLVFLDAPFPAQGKSDVEGFFDPPYFEWYQYDDASMEYKNFDECVNYIEDYIIKHGPFDGLLGFSQGAILAAGLAGLQAQGLALTKVPKIMSLVIIGGAMFLSPTMIDRAYSSGVPCISLHFIGEKDFLKKRGIKLLEQFVDPFVIHHPGGHIVPTLDNKGLVIVENFLQKVQDEIMSCKVVNKCNL